MDFDDILLNMNILLRDNPEALESISSRFDYILVDEYQDTNYAQYVILKKLSAARRDICVVGDDSQSIYAFRGAKIENILNFKNKEPQNEIFGSLEIYELNSRVKTFSLRNYLEGYYKLKLRYTYIIKLTCI